MNSNTPPSLPSLSELITSPNTEYLKSIDSSMKSFTYEQLSVSNILLNTLNDLLSMFNSAYKMLGDIYEYISDNIKPVSEEDKREKERYKKETDKESIIDKFEPSFFQKIISLITIPIVAITSLIYGFFANYLKEISRIAQIKESSKLTLYIAKIESFFVRLTNILKKLVKVFDTKILEPIRLFSDKLIKTIEKVKNSFTEIFNKIPKSVKKIFNKFNPFIIVKDYFSSIIDIINDGFKTLKSTFSFKFFNWLWKYVKIVATKFKGIGVFLNKLFIKVIAPIMGIYEAIKTFMESEGNFFERLWNGIYAGFKKFYDLVYLEIAEWIDWILSAIISSIYNVFSWIVEKITGLDIGSLSISDASILGMIRGFLEKVIGWVNEYISEWFGWVLGGISDFIFGTNINKPKEKLDKGVLVDKKEKTYDQTNIDEYIITPKDDVKYNALISPQTNVLTREEILRIEEEKERKGIKLSDETIKDIGEAVNYKNRSINFNIENNQPYIGPPAPKEKSINRTKEIYDYIYVNGEKIGVTEKEYHEYMKKEIESVGGTYIPSTKEYNPYFGIEDLEKEKYQEQLNYVEKISIKKLEESKKERNDLLKEKYNENLTDKELEIKTRQEYINTPIEERYKRIQELYNEKLSEDKIREIDTEIYNEALRYLENKTHLINEVQTDNFLIKSLERSFTNNNNISYEKDFNNLSKGESKNNNAIVNNYNTSTTVVPPLPSPYINDPSTLSTIRDSLISN